MTDPKSSPSTDEHSFAADNGFGVGLVASDLNAAFAALNRALYDLSSLDPDLWPDDFHPDCLFAAIKSVTLATTEIATLVGLQAVALTHPEKARETRAELRVLKVTQ